MYLYPIFLQVNQSLPVTSAPPNSLPLIGLQAVLIVVLISVFYGWMNAIRAPKEKRKVFLKGFLTIFILALAMVIMFAVMAYLMGLRFF